MFVRTKDGVYLKIRECDENNKILIVGKTITDFGTYIEKKDIIAQSENLDDLCDEFVIEYRDGTMFISIHDNIDDFLIEHKYEIGSGYIKNAYGAIWTDKGLIYVAKMDNKGKLELI